jgi:ABC-type transport system substrate-binding protein
MPDQYKNFSQLARVATTASAQLKQAYWAVRGTEISITYVERDMETAGEIKERLAALGVIVTLIPLDRGDPKRAGKLYYGESGREAAMQIKALVSDIASPNPEDNVALPSDAVALWLEHK